MTAKQFILLLGALVIGLALGKGVKADELDALEAACPPGAEFRIEYRRQLTPRMSRIYVGCRDPETLAKWTYYAELTPQQESQWRSLGSRMMSTSRTWAKPLMLTLPVFSAATTTCDRWYLWADSEGSRAPQMTRSQKIKQGCGP